MSDDWTAADAADRPVEVLTANGRVRVTGAVFVDATGLLDDLQREAHTHRNLYPGGEDDA